MMDDLAFACKQGCYAKYHVKSVVMSKLLHKLSLTKKDMLKSMSCGYFKK